MRPEELEVQIEEIREQAKFRDFPGEYAAYHLQALCRKLVEEQEAQRMTWLSQVRFWFMRGVAAGL